MACRRLHSSITLLFVLAACTGACTSNTFISGSTGGSGGSSGSSTGGASGSGGSAGSSTGGASGSGGSAGSSTGGASGSGGSAGSGTGGASGSGGSAGSGTGGAGGSGGAGGAKVDCSKQPIVFPDFVRACSGGSTSCAIVTHQTDCCGTMVATGINHSQKTAYEAAEKICESQYPGCGCAPQGMKTDSGDTVTDIKQVQVACKNNVCTTYVP